MERPYTTWNLRFETLCPVHVGGGDQCPNITPLGYIRDGNVIRVPPPDALATKLSQDKLLQLCDQLARGGERRLQDLLVPVDPTAIEPIKDMATEKLDATNLPADSNTEIHRCLRLVGFGYPCVPGSSIKGALRSAVYAFWLAENRAQVPGPRDDLCYRPDPKDLHSDFMRVVSTRDIILPRDTAAVYQTQQILQKDGREQLSIPVVVEAIKPGANHDTTWTIASKLPSHLYSKQRPPGAAKFLSSPIQMLEVLKWQADATLQHWLERFDELRLSRGPVGKSAYERLEELFTINDKCEENEALVCLGAYEGWYGKTAAAAFEDDRGAYDKFRLEAQQKYKSRSHPNTFPKTFRVALDRTGGFLDLLGWCKLTYLK